ncbi:MAG: DNA-directed RNA polymerase subunit alpha [Patescibacteria group bacterium]|nr:DNA-directed RNA polymerase subunit alpha [Patescibacteria group bacterium]
MEEVLLPSKIEVTPGEAANTAMLTVEPCYYGYGTTLGNALRRVMLSSLPGAAVIAVKINNAQHEFSAVDGVKEDVLEIILNLKELRMKVHTDEPVRLHLTAKGAKKVTGADIQANSDVEVANPKQHICTLTDKKSEIEMDIFVGRGRGFVPVEEREEEKLELGTIAIDAVYSPVREVGYKVENARVGDITNYDKLVMDIETDGTITPKEAVDQTVSILLDYFSMLTDQPVVEGAEAGEEAEEEVDDEEEEKPKKKTKKAKK